MMDMNNNHYTRKAIEMSGGQAALAKLLRIKAQAVHGWLVCGRIPAERVLRVEEATGGQVTRYQIRPDVFGETPPTRKNRRRKDKVESQTGQTTS